MKNIELMFEKSKDRMRKIKLKDGAVHFESREKFFSGETIKKIIVFINSIHNKYKSVKIPIVFSFEDIIIVDKLSFILFECICYSLIENYNHAVYIYWNPKPDIWTEGVFSSPLKILNTNRTTKNHLEKFKKKFVFDIYKNHFRRVIDGKKDNYLGTLYEELDTFLKVFNIIEEHRDQITEVISELVGNACEHTNSQCLLDIDITTDYCKTVKQIEQNGNFYGINIVILNFSDILLGDAIKNKIKDNNFSTDRYINLNDAYQYHKGKFSDKYTEDDFFNIAVLQDKISGRLNYILPGGTGLTKLVHSLQEKADSDKCYVASGERCVIFVKDLLEYDNKGWLGFNTQRDFFFSIPDSSVITECLMYLPGTAYNLNFVMKREDDSDGK